MSVSFLLVEPLGRVLTGPQWPRLDHASVVPQDDVPGLAGPLVPRHLVRVGHVRLLALPREYAPAPPHCKRARGKKKRDPKAPLTVSLQQPVDRPAEQPLHGPSALVQ